MQNKPHYKLENGKPKLIADGRSFTADSLSNIFSGMGTSSDVRMYNQFQFYNSLSSVRGYGYYNQLEIDAAYQQSWLAQQIVDVPAKDMTRNWREFTCDGAAEIAKYEAQVCLKKKINRLLINARLSGGSIGVLIIDGQVLDKPLDLNKIKKGSFKNVLVFSAERIMPSQEVVSDIYSPHFGEPEYYYIMGGDKGQTGRTIHHTHCLIAKGRELPERLAVYNKRFGDSVLRPVLECLKDLLSSKNGVAALIQKYNVDIIKTDGLREAVTSDLEQQVQARLEMFKMGMSNFSLGVLDITEDLIRNNISFAGVSDILDVLMKFVAGAADIPITRLFNEQSNGSLGDSNKGDLTHYYDGISAEQEEKLRPILEQVDTVLIPSALGENTEIHPFVFKPLYQASETELAQRRLATTQADVIDLENDIVTVAQLQQRRLDQDVYSYEQDDIDSLREYERKQLEEQINGFEDDEFVGEPNFDQPGDVAKAEEGQEGEKEAT